MPNLDKFLNGVMMLGEKQEVLMRTYKSLRDIVIQERDREIRLIDEYVYSHAEDPFEKIMEIQEECERRLDFLKMAMILSGCYQSKENANLQEQEMVRAS